MKHKKSVEKLLADQRIQVYVRAGVFQDLKELSDRTGLSISKIAWWSFSEGYPKVRDVLLKMRAGAKMPHGFPGSPSGNE